MFFPKQCPLCSKELSLSENAKLYCIRGHYKIYSYQVFKLGNAIDYFVLKEEWNYMSNYIENIYTPYFKDEDKCCSYISYKDKSSVHRSLLFKSKRIPPSKKFNINMYVLLQ